MIILDFFKNLLNNKNSGLINHAINEFKIAGFNLDEVSYDSDMANNVLELIKVFARQGHSGYSAVLCVSIFSKLASYRPLSEITCVDSEWVNVVEPDLYQNKRCSAVFKNSKNGKSYYLDAIVWKTQDNVTFTGTVDNIDSRQYIKLPFYPKTFYVDVIDEGEGDNRVTHIKDMNQLIPVYEYYEKGV